MSPFFPGQTAPRSSSAWQQANPAYQDYFPEVSKGYEEDHWDDQAYGISPSNIQVAQQQFLGGVPAHSRAARPAYSGDNFNQPTYTYQTYGQGTAVQPTIPSHQRYSVGTFPNGYGAPEGHTGAADPSLSYGYSGGHGGHGRQPFQAHSPSQRA